LENDLWRNCFINHFSKIDSVPPLDWIWIGSNDDSAMHTACGFASSLHAAIQALGLGID
jgi:hypothetical protein